MINFELAQILYRMADFLELKGIEFKPRAYEKAARAIEVLQQDVKDIYQEDGIKALEKIPSIGKNIALKIEEYIKTGKIKAYKKLKQECPVDIDFLSKIEGLGPRKIKVLYKKLKIKNIKDLEKAAKNGKIKNLEGFGEKSEKNILQGIEFAKSSKNRFLLGKILPVIRNIVSELKKVPDVKKVRIAGSIRRMKETIGDADILVVSDNPSKIMDFFVHMPSVAKIWAQGKTKSSVRLKSGLDCDLRVVKKQSFGSALQYFTGSKNHNIITRRLAIKKNLKLNEYGIKTEKETYKSIGLQYIEPELRENTGEIEAALNNNLPKLIKYKDIKGDCHCHTNWSDGRLSIEELAEIAKKMGYEYIAVTDHAGFLNISNALDENRLLKQIKEIDRINRKIKNIKIIKSAEVDIKKDGTLAIKDEVLEKLDFTIASVHSGMKMPKKEMTERLIRAIKNPNVNIIGHPTCRIIFQRPECNIDLDKIFKIAKQYNTALEINASQTRLDLKDIYIRQAIQNGVKLIISTDAHKLSDLSYMELGIGTARRGWAEKKDILNTKCLKDFLKTGF